ncbi:radical SAM protein [bacterium]|nr:radical SAM protein [bacterium]
MKQVRTAVRSVKNIANFIRSIPAVVLANILLTRRCTQNCLQCTIPRNAGDPPYIPMEHFIFLVDRFDSHGTQFISLSGGEPILHPNIHECLRYAAGKRFVHVQLLSTLYAPMKNVEKTVETLLSTGAGIQVSFDGFDEIADMLRGAPHVSDTVRQGMELLTRENRKLRKPIRTSANIVVSRLNLRQIPDILRYIESLGWKCNVDLYRWTSDNTDEVSDMKIEDGEAFRNMLSAVRNSPAVTTPRVIIDGFPDYLRGKAAKRCPYLDSRGFGTKIYVNPDASVSVCLGKPFGNLLEQTPAELFRSNEWKKRIEEIRACRGCWNSCYTPSGIVFHPSGFGDIRAIWGIIRKG